MPPILELNDVARFFTADRKFSKPIYGLKLSIEVIEKGFFKELPGFQNPEKFMSSTNLEQYAAVSGSGTDYIESEVGHIGYASRKLEIGIPAVKDVRGTWSAFWLYKLQNEYLSLRLSYIPQMEVNETPLSFGRLFVTSGGKSYDFYRLGDRYFERSAIYGNHYESSGEIPEKTIPFRSAFLTGLKDEVMVRTEKDNIPDTGIRIGQFVLQPIQSLVTP